MTKPTNLQEKPFSGRDENGLKPSEWIEKRAEEIFRRKTGMRKGLDNVVNFEALKEDNYIFWNISLSQAVLEYLDLTSKQ